MTEIISCFSDSTTKGRMAMNILSSIKNKVDGLLDGVAIAVNGAIKICVLGFLVTIIVDSVSVHIYNTLKSK